MRRSILLCAAFLLVAVWQTSSFGGELHRTSYRQASRTYYGGSDCDSCVSRGCGVATCGGTCDLCTSCCPRILPALVRGLDNLLQQAFCNPCNIPVCRPRLCQSSCCSDAWIGYGSGDCGCGAGHSENWSPLQAPQPPSEGNPFVDDELQLPPTPPKEARVRRVAPRPNATQRPLAPVVHRPAKPAKIAKIGEPTPAVRHTETSQQARAVQMARAVKPIAHESSSAREIPKNPLRSE